MFVKLVDRLTSTESSLKKLWIENEALGELYFRTGDFKRILLNVLSLEGKPNELKSTLYSFRILQFIICEENRFTNAKWIGGKTIRVITVDKKKYLFLKEKIKQEERS